MKVRSAHYPAGNNQRKERPGAEHSVLVASRLLLQKRVSKIASCMSSCINPCTTDKGKSSGTVAQKRENQEDFLDMKMARISSGTVLTVSMVADDVTQQLLKRHIFKGIFTVSDGFTGALSSPQFNAIGCGFGSNCYRHDFVPVRIEFAGGRHSTNIVIFEHACDNRGQRTDAHK